MRHVVASPCVCRVYCGLSELGLSVVWRCSATGDDIDLITFTNQIAMSLHRVGLAGAAVDLKEFHKLGKKWTRSATEKRDRLTKYALKHQMKEFSPTNDNQIRELLYERLGYPIFATSRKSGKPKVDKATLKRILNEHEESPFIKDLLEFNSVDKLSSTWYGKADDAKRKKSVGALIQPIPHSTLLGLLHFWIFPLRARTGRRASGGGEEGDPESRNSQNWPKPARGVIRSRFPNGKIAVCDYSRLEVVLVGWRAKDDKLLHYFLDGSGYIGVAKEFWGQEVKDGTLLYKATKSMVLGLNYNMGWWKLAEDLWFRAGFKFSNDWNTHVKRTKIARRKYLKLFSGLRHYIRDRIEEVTATQRIVSPSGRVRHFPHHGPESEGFWHIKNACVNYPIQSFASDITGGAIVDYEKEVLAYHGFSYNDWHSSLLTAPWDPICSPIFNEVHDELNLDLHKKTGKRDLEILIDCMRSCRSVKRLVPEFDLKLKMDVQIVNRWGDAT